MKQTLVSIFIFSWSLGIAQETNQKNNYFEVSGLYGLTIPSLKPGKFFIESRQKGFNLYFGKRNLDSMSWSQSFRNPDHGLGLMCNFLDENQILGNSFTIYYKINMPFYKVKKSGIYYTVSIGSSLINNPFHPQINYLNLANGSKINVFAHFGINSRIQLYKNYLLLLGFNFYHISNGNIKLPNEGLNLIAFETGLSYKFNVKKYHSKNQRISTNNKRKYYLTAVVGSKQTRILGNNYFIYSVAADVYFYTNAKRSIGAGIDLVYDNTFDHYFNTDSSYFDKEKRFIYNGIYLAHKLNLNKVSILTNVGYYIDYYSIVKDNFFYYLGVRYFVTDQIFAGFGIKARLNGGDFIGWGIGYAF